MSNEQSGSGQSAGGGAVPKSHATTESHLSAARASLVVAAEAHGTVLDEVSREILSAASAIDRARRILREGR